MSLEAATYIDGLVSTNPLIGDARSEGDDHLRLVKSVIKATFPNITGAMTLTQVELNALPALAATKAPMPIGTVCLFYQAAAPTGWTKVLTQDNKALRVVSGSGGVTGNDASANFTTAFASKAVTGSNSPTTLTLAQIPSHTHSFLIYGTSGGGPNASAGSAVTGATTNVTDGGSGGGGSHNHTFTGTAINMYVQYIDIILASRTT